MKSSNRYKRYQRYCLAFIGVLFLSSAHAEDFGSIQGQVNFCDRGGLDGVVVHIPGRQYTVITDSTGKFKFDLVPVGVYEIHYRYKDKSVYSNSGVLVNDGATTNLQKISLCNDILKSLLQSKINILTKPSATGKKMTSEQSVDNDRDGVPLGQDCNDNDAAIRPGAIEICDGIDNNCDGSIDENSEYVIMNGIGKCNNGIVKVDQCTDGYADCDSDSSNGCEIHIDTDVENCGACGNFCSSMDMCAQGLC